MIGAVILAGGLARRMGGGDKTLRLLGGHTVLARIVERLRPQVDVLALNANGDAARFAAYGLPVLPDEVEGYPGPLAGVLAGMAWARGLGLEWLVTAPADAPFLPDDFVAQLIAGRGDAPFACAASGGRTHPVAALWPVSAAPRLMAALTAGQRKIDAVTGPGVAAIAWPIIPFDPFFNVNTPEDLAVAATLL